MSAAGQVDTLPEGYLLHWYEISGVLGRGGFGITYLAKDTNLEQRVAIKEYLPSEYASRQADSTVAPTGGDKAEIYRWGLERFLNEARTLAQFRHPNIVRVVSVFEQNNTAYMVMEYERGVDLAHYLEEHGKLNEDELLALFMPVLDGLALVHETGFIHRDIKPANIYIRDDGTPILLDFGSARLALGDHTRTLTSLVTGGYAPFEQYHTQGENQGPWSDIYSVGATLYRIVAGKPPVDALTRGSARLNGEPDPLAPLSIIAAGAHDRNFLLAIDNALLFREADRPQDVNSWMRMLDGSEPVPPLPAGEFARPGVVDPDAPTVLRPSGVTARSRRPAVIASAPHRQRKSVRRSSVLLAVTGVGVLALMLGAGLVVWRVFLIEPPSVAPVEETVSPDPALAERRARIETLLASAAGAEAESRLVAPPQRNALAFYREVLRIEPGNAEAERGVARLLRHYVVLAESQIAADRLDQAGASLDTADGIRTGTLEARQARVKLSERAVALRQAELDRMAAQAELERVRNVITRELANVRADLLEVAGARRAAEAGGAPEHAAEQFTAALAHDTRVATHVEAAELALGGDDFTAARAAMASAREALGAAAEGYARSTGEAESYREQQRLLAAQRERERREAERQETERQETERQETERQETERQEAERQEAERREAERREAERREAERREAERLEAEQARARRLSQAQASLVSVMNAAAHARAEQAAADDAAASTFAAGDYEPARRALADALALVAEGEGLIAANRPAGAQTVLEQALALLARAEAGFGKARATAGQLARDRARQARSRSEAQLRTTRELAAIVATEQANAARFQAQTRAASAYGAAAGAQQQALARIREGEALSAAGDDDRAAAAFTNAGELLAEALEGFVKAARLARQGSIAEARSLLEEQQRSLVVARDAADSVAAQRWSRIEYERAVQLEARAVAARAAGENLLETDRVAAALGEYEAAAANLADAAAAYETATTLALERSAQEQAREAQLASVEQRRAVLNEARTRLARARVAAEAAGAELRANDTFDSARELERRALSRIIAASELLDAGEFAAAEQAFEEATALSNQSAEEMDDARKLAVERLAAEQQRAEERATVQRTRAAVNAAQSRVAQARLSAEAAGAPTRARAEYDAARGSESRALEQVMAAAEAMGAERLPAAEQALREGLRLLKDAMTGFDHARELAVEQFARERLRASRLAELERQRDALGDARRTVRRERIAAQAAEADRFVPAFHNAALALEAQAETRAGHAGALLEADDLDAAGPAFADALAAYEAARTAFSRATRLALKLADAERANVERARLAEHDELTRQLAGLNGAFELVARARAGAEAAQAPALAGDAFRQAVGAATVASERRTEAERAIGDGQFDRARAAWSEIRDALEGAAQAFARAAEVAAQRLAVQQRRERQLAALQAALLELDTLSREVEQARDAAEANQAPTLAGEEYERAAREEALAGESRAGADRLVADGRLETARARVHEAHERLASAVRGYALAQASAERSLARQQAREEQRAAVEAKRAAVAALVTTSASARAAAEAGEAQRLAPDEYRAARGAQIQGAEQLAFAQRLIEAGSLGEAGLVLDSALASLDSAARAYSGATVKAGERRREESRLREEQDRAEQLTRVEASRAHLAPARERLLAARRAAERAEAPRLAPDAFNAARQQQSGGNEKVARAEQLTSAGEVAQALGAWEEALSALDEATAGFRAARRQSDARRAREDEAERRVQALLEAVAQAGARVADSRSEAEALAAGTRAPDVYRSAAAAHADAERLTEAARKYLAERRLEQAEQVADTVLGLLETADNRFGEARELARKAIDRETPPRPDIEIVVERVREFSRALRDRDLPGLEQVAAFSDQRRAFVETLFRQYREIEVSVADITLLSAEGSASAVITIERLVDQDGNRVIPGPNWREARIEVHKTDSGWGKFNW